MRCMDQPPPSRAVLLTFLLLSALSGVVNGIDYNEWDPATDEHLRSDGYCNYDTHSLARGKARCKAALQRVSAAGSARPAGGAAAVAWRCCCWRCCGA